MLLYYLWLSFVMKNYDIILIGTGSGMEIIAAMIQENQKLHVAVIDKDTPGGICLTRGCIPSKLLIYPANVLRTVQKSHIFGIQTEIKSVAFKAIMERMRSLIDRDVNTIRNGLLQSKNIDYYTEQAEFTAPYIVKVGKVVITAKMIFLSTGSRPSVPPVDGLQETGYLTSDTILGLTQLPSSIAIIGGGYIAAEYGHFLSAMGSKVTIIGRNPLFIPEEEPEVSALAKRELQKHVTILTNHEVRKAEATPTGKKLTAVDRYSKKGTEIVAEEILVATGRVSNNDILHPEKAGIDTDAHGFITADEYLQTSQPNIWVLGDADGRFMFKHVANHEAQTVYYNAVLKKKIKKDYHAVPHAVFTDPEIASVALREQEAVEKYGKDNILIGFYKYADTARGEAMALKDEFVKVIIRKDTRKIIGAHIIGPEASVLIQEIVNLMYTETQTLDPINAAMHIHPALSEVVARAFQSFMIPEQYHHFLAEHSGLPLE
jgi:mycothione reductase